MPELADEPRCPACEQPLADRAGCSVNTLGFRESDGRIVEHAAVPYDHPDHLCHDCGVVHGEVHHADCDMAACPRCGDQLLFCDCDLVDLEAA